MKPKFTKDELSRLLCYNEKDSFIKMPNEIFEQLTSSEEIMAHKAPHVAVMYTYLYLNAWLYRNAKYDRVDNPMETLDVKGIKGIIGVSPTGQEYNYAFKKDGALDKLGLTATVSWLEAPVDVQYMKGEWHEFTYYGDWYGKGGEYYNETGAENIKRRTIKEPLFGTTNERVWAVQGQEYGANGTFYEFGYTTDIPFDVFLECMTNKELGCKAFYVYGYLHSRCCMNYKSGGLVEVSLEKISTVTGLRADSRDKALQSLKKYGLVEVVVPADFYIGRQKGVETPANIYKTITDVNKFSAEPKKFLKGKVRYAKDDENLATTEDIDKQIEDLFS